jgi:hypothetical protein
MLLPVVAERRLCFPPPLRPGAGRAGQVTKMVKERRRINPRSVPVFLGPLQKKPLTTGYNYILLLTSITILVYISRSTHLIPSPLKASCVHKRNQKAVT